jgi:hypothetical protein
MIDAAVSAGMSTGDPLKREPSPAVFARGTAQDRGKAVAVGTVKSPSNIYLRIRSTTFSELYVEWTLTCTNGTRSETTSDRGTADAPLEIPLRVGIAGAKSCAATASAVSSAPSNYEEAAPALVDVAQVAALLAERSLLMRGL